MHLLDFPQSRCELQLNNVKCKEKMYITNQNRLREYTTNADGYRGTIATSCLVTSFQISQKMESHSSQNK